MCRCAPISPLYPSALPLLRIFRARSSYGSRSCFLRRPFPRKRWAGGEDSSPGSAASGGSSASPYSLKRAEKEAEKKVTRSAKEFSVASVRFAKLRAKSWELGTDLEGLY